MTGSEPTTEVNVLKALQEHHGQSLAEARALISTHYGRKALDDSILFRSFVYYPVGLILRNQGTGHTCDVRCRDWDEVPEAAKP